MESTDTTRRAAPGPRLGAAAAPKLKPTNPTVASEPQGVQALLMLQAGPPGACRGAVQVDGWWRRDARVTLGGEEAPERRLGTKRREEVDCRVEGESSKA